MNTHSEPIPGRVGVPAAITEAIGRARRVQIIGHVRPDGDCIGSMLALQHMLRGMTRETAMAAPEIPFSGYVELPDFDRIAERPDPAFAPDLVVAVDCANLERSAALDGIAAPLINIDHHGTNARFGAVNWVEPDRAATGEMIYILARHLGRPITPEIADALFIAISTDTGSFRYANTGPEQLRIASELVHAGAQPARLSRIAYNSLAPEGVRLMGLVLAGMRLECGGRLAWAEITAEDYATAGGHAYAPENLPSCLMQVRGVEVGALFHEMGAGVLRVNLRAQNGLDVSRLAARWGGGGHHAAAGCSKDGVDYVPTRDAMLADLRALMDD